MSAPASTDLRALDWRYLLPTPQAGRFRRLVILGAGDSHAALAVEAGLADAVYTTITPEADAVVVLADAAPRVRDVVRAVSDGGVVLWQVDRRAPGGRFRTPGRLRRALRRHGVARPLVYGLTPHPRRPHMYLPLEDAAPLRWFLRTLFLANTTTSQATGVALATLTRIPGGIHLLEHALPGFVVVGMKGERRPTAAVLDSVELPPTLRVADARVLLLTWGANESNRVAALPFAPNADRPAFVLKLARSDRHGQGTRDEQQALTALAARLPADLRATVPCAFGAFERNGAPVGAESCVPGRLLACIVGDRRASFGTQMQAFEHAVDWLVRFHTHVREGVTTWEATTIARMVDAPFRRYADALGVTEAETRLFDAARTRAAALAGITVPRVWQHTGFSGINIFVDHRTAYVIDWECSAPGLPLLDLLQLAMDWSADVARADTEAGRLADFEALALAAGGSHPCRPVVQSAVDRYLRALGLPPALVPLACVLLHVHRALGFVDASGRQPGARRENGPARYVELLAGYTATLFPS